VVSSKVKEPKKVDVVRSKPRTTETVGDDGTLDSDFLSKPRKAPTLVKPYHMAYTHVPQHRWDSIFMKSGDDVASHDKD
jgi:hypothetical protein